MQSLLVCVHVGCVYQWTCMTKMTKHSLSLLLAVGSLLKVPAVHGSFVSLDFYILGVFYRFFYIYTQKVRQILFGWAENCTCLRNPGTVRYIQINREHLNVPAASTATSIILISSFHRHNEQRNDREGKRLPINGRKEALYKLQM